MPRLVDDLDALDLRSLLQGHALYRVLADANSCAFRGGVLGGVVMRLGVLQHENHLLRALRLCDLGLRR